MELIAYTSEYCGAESEISAVLESIRRVAKPRNAERGITGVLFYDHGRFVQVLEGESDALETLMREIERDPRHRNIKYLLKTEIKARELPNWNMDTFNLTDKRVLKEATLVKIRDIYLETLKPKSSTFIAILKDLLSNPKMQDIINA